MAEITEYDIQIKFKDSGAEKTAKDIDKVKDSTERLKSTIKGIGIGAVLKKATDAIGGFINKTADYIETVNLFRASMGSAADEAQNFINKAEKMLGLDPKVMMDSISRFQNLGESLGISSDRAYLMSKNLTQLSADLSSFANISMEQAQQKLMSGFSGQVKPLREYGIALTQASLQETAYSLGIQEKVKNMTQAQKTELIYYQIMTSTQKIQGDLGRSLLSPANALRVMKAEFQQLARAVGSIFIPIMMKLIPVIRAVTQMLTEAAKAIARFFGYNLGDYEADLGSVGNLLEGVGDGIGDIGDQAEGTAKKLNKMLMPFDELNNITTSSGLGGGSGIGGIGGGGGGLGIDLPQYDMFASMSESMTQKIEKIKNIIKEILPFIEAIGIAFAAWKISNTVLNGIDKLFNLSKDSKAGILELIMGTVLLFEGIKMVIGSVTKMINGDLTITTLLEGIFGSILAGAGAALITTSLLGGPGVGIAIGLVLLLAVILTWSLERDTELYTKIAKAQGLEYKDMSFWGKAKLRIDTNLELLGLKQGDENTEWGKAVNKYQQESGAKTKTSSVLVGALPTYLFNNKDKILEGFSKFFTQDLPQWLGKNMVQSWNDMWKFVDWSNVDFNNKFSGAFKFMGDQFSWEKVEHNFVTVRSIAKGIVDRLVQGVLETFQEDYDRILGIGTGIVEGVITGFQEKWSEFTSFINIIWENFIKGVKDQLGIHSPSTVFEEIGINLIQGFIDGIQSIWGKLTQKFDDIKNLTNFSWSLPQLKVPKISWTTTPAPSWMSGILSKLNLPTNLPQLKISWDSYANGGFPEDGQLFIANEAGPELIGNIGNRTAVANQDQITTAIANATYKAVSRALAENSQNDGQPIIVNVGNEQLYKGYTNYRNKQSNMYGINV